MQTAVNTTITALVAIVQSVGIGTNVSLLRLLWVMVNGSFLGSRGAVHSALAANAFSDEEVRRSWAALRYGQWEIDELLTNWQIHVAATNGWRVRRHRGYRVKSVDITGFFRSRLQGAVSQHYAGLAQRALPAMVFGVMITSGQIQEKRVPLLEKIVRCEAGTSESTFRGNCCKPRPRRPTLMKSRCWMRAFTCPRFIWRNSSAMWCAWPPTARRARIVYPSTKDVGHARNTALIRPLARKHKGRTIAASQAQQQGRFAYKGRTIRYHIWPQLVTVNTKVDEDNPTFTLMLFFDPCTRNP
ncbi:MAG: hypothetical protein R3A44_14135 [Caldilineaceae bacterium]